MNKNAFKNKKGITFAFRMLEFLWRLFFLIGISLAVVFLIRGYIVDQINVSELEDEIFLMRTLYSPTAISYLEPETNRLYPGIIDLDNFNSERLNKSMYLAKGDIPFASNLKLISINNEKLAEAYYNPIGYKHWVSYVEYPGPGRTEITTKKRFYVLVEDNGEIKPAVLEFIIIKP